MKPSEFFKRLYPMYMIHALGGGRVFKTVKDKKPIFLVNDAKIYRAVITPSDARLLEEYKERHSNDFA